MIKLKELDIRRVGADRFFSKHWKMFFASLAASLCLTCGLGYINQWLGLVGVVPYLVFAVWWVRSSRCFGRDLVDAWRDGGVDNTYNE